MNSGSDMDWLYMRAYPELPTLVDAAAKSLVPWLASVAAEEGATKWFFMRYLDMTGQHLRMRLYCSTDGVDRISNRFDEVRHILSQLDRSEAESKRLIPGASFDNLPGGVKVNTSVYSPELDKYGGVHGVDLAEQLFTYSTGWFCRGNVSSLDPLHERSILAAEIMVKSVALVFPDSQKEFWRSHQKKWSFHLRSAIPNRDDLMTSLEDINSKIRIDLSTEQEHLRLSEQLALRLKTTVDRAENLDLTRSKQELFLEYLHMEMNRLGFLPAEECALGIVAAQYINDK